MGISSHKQTNLQYKPTHIIINYVIATFAVKVDKLDAFLAAVKPMVIATNKEKGCLRYNIYQDKKDKCKIVMVEEWDCQSNLTNHLTQKHVKKFNELQKKEQMAKQTPSIYFCGGPVI